MQEQDIIKTLRALKRISPDPAYTAHSRRLVLSAPQHSTTHHLIKPMRIRTFLRLSAIASLGIAGVFMILGGTTYINETYSPLALEGLNQRSLTAEANEINNSIEITLGTIEYLDTSRHEALTKIAQISDPEPTVAAATLIAAPAVTMSIEATSTKPEPAIETFLIESEPSNEPIERTINAILEQVAQ